MAKGCSNNKYEEARKQRLEENKKRFEDLGISAISKKLTEIASPAKKTQHYSPKPRSKTNEVVEPRRSSRVRNPVPSYSEEFGVDLRPLRKRSRSNSSWGSYVARPLDEIKEATDDERIRALEAAEELQTNLKSSNPMFIKSMLRSHVYSCFWLGLPSRFCEEHLPKTVCNMVLEDENGSKYESVYIGRKTGLSGGWRAFALDHKLDDGDALVFELVEAARFKVYIVRAFPESVKEDGENILEEEGNKRAAKVKKEPNADSNGETESNKTKKAKRAIVYETKESESSQEQLPETSTDHKVKPQGVNTKRKAKISEKKTPKKSKLTATSELNEEEQIETVKQKTATKMTNKTRKSKEGIVCETLDSDVKNEPVEDADNELKKVEPIKEASKSVSQRPRKKPAPKLFRKRA